jgi:uncharacterized protein YegL
MEEEFSEIEAPVVPKSFDQLGILVLDGSGSMHEEGLNKITKAEMVSTAVKELISRMRISKNQANFSFAIVTFDASARVAVDITPVSNLSATDDYDPTAGHGGGTNIAAGLVEARKLVGQFLHQGSETLKKTVVVVIMTDGESQDLDRSVEIANELKGDPAVTICTTYFAKKGKPNPAAKDLLLQLASDPNKFLTVFDGDTLRDFFIASVTAAAPKRLGQDR